MSDGTRVRSQSLLYLIKVFGLGAVASERPLRDLFLASE